MGALNPVKKNQFTRLSFFHITGITALLISLIILFINPVFSLVPFFLFLLICTTAPFLPGLSFFLPVISKGKSGRKAVALTFDDGPDPEVTPAVLELLAKYNAKASFFVTGKKSELYPSIIKKILESGHSIGNHSYKHDPLLMLRTKSTLFKEICICQDILKKSGITAHAFRPPSGIMNPRLRKVLLDMDMFCINWSCRAFDAGNRKIKFLAKRILRKVKPGDIILLHDINPNRRNNINNLISEFEALITGLKNAGFSIIPLSEIIGRKIMTK